MENDKLFPGILTEEVMVQLETISIQLNKISRMLDEGKDPGIILSKMKTTNNTLIHAFYLLVNDVYLKVLTQYTETQDWPSEACSYETKIEFIKRQFPEAKLDELMGKLNELKELERQLEEGRNKLRRGY